MKTQYIITILTIFCTISCSKKSANSNLIIEKDIKSNSVFKKLNDSLEFRLRKRDSIGSKRSTNITFEININDTISHITKLKAKSSFLNSYYIGKNNEKLQVKESDTLAVYIDNFDGYSSEGIKLLLYKDNYDIKYYMTSDVILPTKPIELTKVNFSKIILDKKKYKVGDSIYGFIDTNLTYQNRFSLPQKITAKGYFRTIIKENNY